MSDNNKKLTTISTEVTNTQTRENQVTPQDVIKTFEDRLNEALESEETNVLDDFWAEFSTQPPSVQPVVFEQPELIQFIPQMFAVGEYPDEADTVVPGPVLPPQDLNGEGVTPVANPIKTESRNQTPDNLDTLFDNLDSEEF